MIANGVDPVQAGIRIRREFDFVHRLPVFPWFSSWFGNAYERSTLSSCCAQSDGKHILYDSTTRVGTLD